MFTVQCAMCKETVGHGPECSNCKLKYHFNCAGITERGFNRLGRNRESWLCSSCKDGTSSGSRVDDAVPETPVTPKFSSGLQLESGLSSTPMSPIAGVRKQALPQTDMLSVIHSKISDMQEQLSVIFSIQKDMQQVKEDMSQLKATFVSGFDDITARVNDIDSRVTALELMKVDLETVKSKVTEIVDDRLKNDQWVRRSNIQINGVPQKSGENLIEVAQSLAKLSGFPLKPETDIDFITRVAVRNDVDGNKPKPIILKMQSRYRKDDFLSTLRRLKNIKAADLGFVGNHSGIFCNDHLSAHNKYLLQQAKLKAKEKKYAYCWVRNCTVMVRQTEKSPVLHITSEQDLRKIA